MRDTRCAFHPIEPGVSAARRATPARHPAILQRLLLLETWPMPRSDEISKARREAEECPTAWFAVLERARENNDFERAAEAMRELKRLGVTVRFHRRPKRGRRGGPS